MADTDATPQGSIAVTWSTALGHGPDLNAGKRRATRGPAASGNVVIGNVVVGVEVLVGEITGGWFGGRVVTGGEVVAGRSVVVGRTVVGLVVSTGAVVGSGVDGTGPDDGTSRLDGSGAGTVPASDVAAFGVSDELATVLLERSPALTSFVSVCAPMPMPAANRTRATSTTRAIACRGARRWSRGNPERLQADGTSVG